MPIDVGLINVSAFEARPGVDEEKLLRGARALFEDTERKMGRCDEDYKLHELLWRRNMNEFKRQAGLVLEA